MLIFIKNTSIYLIKCFHPKKLPFYILSAGLTYFLIYSGIDWKWFQFFTFRQEYQYVLVSAAFIGLVMPIIGPIILYRGLLKQDDRLFKTGYSLIQVVIIALLISSLMKAFTGRLHPGFLAGPQYVDYSHIFHFGFLEGGIFHGWPSGHLMTTFAMIFCIIRRFQSNRALIALCCCYGLFILFGVSATIHWLSDSFAGVIIGILIGYTVDDPADEIFKEKHFEPNSKIHMAYLGSIAFFFIVSVLAIVLDFSNFTINLIGLTYFIDIPSFLIVLPPAVFFGIAATSTQACKLSCRIILENLENVSREKAKEASRFLQVTGNSSLMLGLYGTLAGAMILGHRLENLSDLGPALAVASITTFYGMGFQLVFYVADQRLKNKYLSEE